MSIRIVTNAITIATNVQRAPGPAGPQQQPANLAQPFIDLLDIANGTSTVMRQMLGNAEATKGGQILAGAQQATTDTAGSEEQSTLDDLLGRLMAELKSLTERLDDGEILDRADLEKVDELMAGIEDLLAAGVPLPGPQDPAFSMLAELGTSIGGDSSKATAPFERLAGMVAKLADGVSGQSPDLASRLTEFTKSLDVHSAAIQSAQADEQAEATGAIRHIESETKRNPAAAIAKAEPNTPGVELSSGRVQSEGKSTDTDIPEDAGRTLVKSDAKAGPGTQTGSQDTGNGSNHNPSSGSPQTGVQPATAPTPGDGEAPDGFAVQSAQAQNQSAGPQAAARPEAAAYQRPETHVNLPHVAAEISRHIQNGVNRFEVRLNPPELGRIDVRMEMDNSGNVIARLAVERSETLDLLQRDQRALMRALADAGVDAGKTELEFSLQQDGGQGASQDEPGPWANNLMSVSGPDAPDPQTIAEQSLNMSEFARLDAVNLWV